MIETLETVDIEAPAKVDACPFCGADPYWMGVVREEQIEPHFYHPGVATDDDCVLSGRGFGRTDVENWNRRVTAIRYAQPCSAHEYIEPGCADCGKLEAAR